MLQADMYMPKAAFYLAYDEIDGQPSRQFGLKTYQFESNFR